jgi:serine/threonine protein kinase
VDKVRAARFEKELVGKHVGGWSIRSLINNGASAVVFEAERDLNVAALKIFDPELVERVGEDKQLARISAELKLVGHSHDHLVRIFDGGKSADAGYCFIAMERLQLPALSTHIADFPVDQIRPLIAQIASAAKYLESLGLVHRDIKPDNIVVSDDLSRAVLLDFGVIRPVESGSEDERGSGQHFLATARYSSPEYLMREEEDSEDGWRALTFYQLGGVLYDMIMHKQLFVEYFPPPARLTEAVRSRVPIIDARGVPPDLLLLARNCLQKDWRIRLQLVRWEDFSSEPPKEFDLSIVMERNRRRLIAAESASVHIDDGGLAQKTEALATDTANHVDVSIREIWNQARVFPLISVYRPPPTTGTQRHVRVEMAAAPPLLEHTVKIFIESEVLDGASGAVRVAAACFCGDYQQDWPSPANWKTLFAGVFDSGILNRRLTELLHITYDEAQNCPA